MRYAEVDSGPNYICLSYVWGPPIPGQTILLDGRCFWVRENLWHFLESARRNQRLKDSWLWIDAIAIDQANPDERAQQVQQMGRTFQIAQKVISWFGSDKIVASYLQQLDSLQTDSGYRYFGPCESHFKDNNYWKRAWITQEVALARNLTFMAADVQLNRDSAPLHVRKVLKAAAGIPRVHNTAWRTRK